MDAYEVKLDVDMAMSERLIDIGMLVGKITHLPRKADAVLLGYVKSIYATLAIEKNPLSLDQMKRVMDDGLGVGDGHYEVEVWNAWRVYKEVVSWNGYDVQAFLKAHGILMDGLGKEAGMFRTKEVGVFCGTSLIHQGTLAKDVRHEIEKVFTWAKESKIHPLLKSCVVHYEIERIHPFWDGNGRMGRLWQKVILSSWCDAFAFLPLEYMVLEYLPSYYKALADSDACGDVRAFVMFMLDRIYACLKEFVTMPLSQEDRLYMLLKMDGHGSARSYGERLGISVRHTQRLLYDLKAKGKIERMGSGKSGYWRILV